MLITNDNLQLQINEQGGIDSIKFKNQEILVHFTINLLFTNNTNQLNRNLWANIKWEWIRDKQTITLLGTNMEVAIDIQCFINLSDNNTIIIDWWIANLSHQNKLLNFQQFVDFANHQHQQITTSINASEQKNISTEKTINETQEINLQAASIWKTKWTIQIENNP